MRTDLWTDAEKAVLQDYPTGNKDDMLRRLPGRTWQAIEKQARALGMRRREGGAGSPEWEDGQTERLIELWDGDRPTREIADILGLTRNQVIGKAHRLGLRHNAATWSKARKDGAARIGKLLDGGYNARTCQFIEGEPEGMDTVYCGDDVKVGSSYCEMHHALCYREMSPPSEVKKPFMQGARF